MHYESDDDIASRAAKLERPKKQPSQKVRYSMAMLQRGMSLRRPPSPSAASPVHKPLKKSKSGVKTVVNRAFVARSMSCPDLFSLTRSRRGVADPLTSIDLAVSPPATFGSSPGSAGTGRASISKAASTRPAATYSIKPFSTAAHTVSSPAAGAAAGAATGIVGVFSPAGIPGVPAHHPTPQIIGTNETPMDFVVVRRQSFPSLENAIWKESQVEVGLI
jgi:hypothetical protein